MSDRLRIVSVTVQVNAVIDDGTELTPIQTQPIGYSAGEWKTFDLNDYRDRLQAEYDRSQEL